METAPNCVSRNTSGIKSYALGLVSQKRGAAVRKGRVPEPKVSVYEGWECGFRPRPRPQPKASTTNVALVVAAGPHIVNAVAAGVNDEPRTKIRNSLAERDVERLDVTDKRCRGQSSAVPLGGPSTFSLACGRGKRRT